MDFGLSVLIVVAAAFAAEAGGMAEGTFVESRASETLAMYYLQSAKLGGAAPSSVIACSSVKPYGNPSDGCRSGSCIRCSMNITVRLNACCAPRPILAHLMA